MNSEKCQNLLHELYNYTLRKEFEQERQIARELYSISTGKVHDDDLFFESRMACFQEFFLFDYRLSELFSGSTVFETFLFNAQSVLSLEEINDFEQLRSFEHSLFTIHKIDNERIIVENMLNKMVEEVYSLPEFSFSGFDEKQIFEGRIINVNKQKFFTGSFILHNSQVRSVIEKYVNEFLAKKSHCKYKEAIGWKKELMLRKDLVSSLTEQKSQIQQLERKKSIDLLNITKKIAEIPRKIISKNLLMSLGENETMSSHVPETPFYDFLPLLHMLSYCEVRSYRYKHIDPVKIYEVQNFKIDPNDQSLTKSDLLAYY